MPSHICAVPFCQSRKSGTISIHGFPNDVSLRHEWLNSIVKTTGVERYEIGEYSVVCSKHFTEEYFHVSKDERKLLKKGSLPTIFEQPTEAIMMPSTSHGRIFRTSDWAFSDAGYNRTNTEGIVDKSQHVPMMVIMQTNICSFIFMLSIWYKFTKYDSIHNKYRVADIF
ncbi:unnamed protein product [Phaedon cochleariae]|uniref:THAP-type domain-containing protein n=1 Tax=Phaedon cochleariae TaxID=80249 RepID=A0A9N9SKW4_PHACE|nr:unnamed protein product [Phaedon cochleariae]